MRQEADDSFPGDFPEVRVSRLGVGAVKDPSCVHDQQHVLQRLRDGFELKIKTKQNVKLQLTKLQLPAPDTVS